MNDKTRMVCMKARQLALAIIAECIASMAPDAVRVLQDDRKRLPESARAIPSAA